MKAKEIIDFLREKLETYSDIQTLYADTSPIWKKHPYGFGDTSTGFTTTYTLNWKALEKEMDLWIKETFGEK